MKYFSILAVLLLLAVSVQGQDIIPDLPAPTEGWADFGVCDVDVAGGEFYHYAYWAGAGEAQDTTNYGPVTDLINVAGSAIEVILDNEYYVHNHKIIRIRIVGTGATGAPENVVVTTSNLANDPSPMLSFEVVEASNTSGSWVIDIVIAVGPQPDEVIVTFDVPGSPAVGEGWLSECCQRPTIPSMTTYGLIILAVLILASGYFVLRRRRATA